MAAITRKGGKGKSLISGAVGKVVQTDRQTIVISVEPESRLHHRDFIEVRFPKEGNLHILIGQVELLVGEDVKIGSATSQRGVSILGIGIDVVQTKDVEETRVRATAKVVAFIDHLGKVSAHDPTIDYMAQPVFLADAVSLKKVFSELNNLDLAPLEVGTLLGSPDIIPVSLNPEGFMRHTAIFGQSGSGKSFSFGIILEELIKETDARVLVLDPNSDYRNFSHLRARADIKKYSRREYTAEEHELLQQRWKELAQLFLRFSRRSNKEDKKLALSFSDLLRSQQAGLLGIDPVHDREEYSVFRETVESLGESYTLNQILDIFSYSPSVEKVRLLYRIKNRELDKLSLWGEPSIIEELRNNDWSFASIDLRDVTPLERSLASAAVLEALYRDIIRSRKVTFFVVDEAHNFCPAVPWESHQEAPRQILHEIAAEGRKYGAFLMLMTQNPSKLSEQVMLQCDNVILMKMTSGIEVKALEAIVGDAGPRLAQAAFSLNIGEAICMGGIVRNEASVKFDLRKTTPGGEDVSKEWARRKM